MENLRDSKFDEKLDLVIDLLNDNEINIHKLISKYQDAPLVSKLLGLDTTITQQDLNELEQKLAGNEHHKDFRDTVSFARNLVVNWLIEDAIVILAERNDLKVNHTGKDGKRELLQGWRANSDPDLEFTLDESKLWVEVIANFPTANFDSYWEQSGEFDLRDYKLKTLKDKAKNQKTIVLGINVKQKKFFTFQIHENTEGVLGPEPKFGGKPAMKIKFPGGKPTLQSFDNLPYALKNITRQKIYKPLRPGNELEDMITQYFEVQRGFCVVTKNTDRNLIHVQYKVTTDNLNLHYVYAQQATDNSVVQIPVDHIMNNYDFGFQFSFNNKDQILYWDGSVLKHHIEYNLVKKKVWEQYLDRETKTMLVLPADYVPSLQVGRISEDFQKIL